MVIATQPVRYVDCKSDIEDIAEKPAFRFDLTPVLSRCGKRTLGNPERLRLICEHHVLRRAPDELLFFDEVGFVLVVRTCRGQDALGIAQAIHTALLTLFFGDDRLAASEIGQLFREVPAAEICELTTVSESQKAAAPAMPTRRADTLEAEGQVLGFVPVYDLRRDQALFYLCTPMLETGDRAFALSGPSEYRFELDERMLAHSVMLAGQIKEANLVAAAIAPVSYETLATQRARRSYQRALADAKAPSNPYLIVKLEDIPSGVPASRLVEIMWTVRPYARRVFIELPRADSVLFETGRLGTTGIFARQPPDATLFGMIKFCQAITRSASVQHACSYIENVSDARSLAVARACGVQFASGPALSGSAPCLAPKNVLAALSAAVLPAA